MTDDKLSQLNQFTGTDQWYKNPLFPKFLYTDGVRYVAEEAGAYWLIDKIFALQYREDIRSELFQVWKLKVNDDATAIVSVEDGNDNHIYAEKLTYTDFPTCGINLYFTDNVLLLPSEY